VKVDEEVSKFHAIYIGRWFKICQQFADVCRLTETGRTETASLFAPKRQPLRRVGAGERRGRPSARIIAVAYNLALVLFGVAVVAQLALGLYLHGRLWQGGRKPELVTPATKRVWLREA
jgi:hypothetical protein